MSGAGELVVEARDIVRGYGRRRVLQGVDLTLDAGEVVALLGPNGAGKTTFLKVLVGLLDADSGRVTGPIGRGVGWIPQGGATYARMTVRENLELFARLLRLEGNPTELAEQSARLARLTPWLDRTGSELSGGLRQRLNVAVGLLGDPRMLVLDEPTTGVDLAHRAAMFHVLRERADAGCAVLCSTHTLDDAMSADRAVVLVAGRIAYAGTLDDIANAALDVEIDETLQVTDPISRGLLRLWAGTDEGAVV
jgi:ABC-2 type transport system ATP-binding protein